MRSGQIDGRVDALRRTRVNGERVDRAKLPSYSTLSLVSSALQGRLPGREIAGLLCALPDVPLAVTPLGTQIVVNGIFHKTPGCVEREASGEACPHGPNGWKEEPTDTGGVSPQDPASLPSWRPGSLAPHGADHGASRRQVAIRFGTPVDPADAVASPE